MRKTLTDKGVAALKPKAARYAFPDPEMRGLFVRVQSSGAKAFVVVSRDPHGKQLWVTLGGADVLSIKAARDKAREVIGRIRAGKPAFDAPPVQPDSFAAVAENWLKRHVQAKGLRSQTEIERILVRYVLPTWGSRDFVSIRRSDITQLLDHVEDQHGGRTADYVLSITRAIANWHASRHDDYISPFTRGMRRTDPQARKRARILDDDEIRLVWKAAENQGRFGAIVRLLLLTAQRREKVGTLQWADVSVDGTWSVPADHRAKGTGGALLLPTAALEIIHAQPQIGDNPYVFAGSGKGPFSGYSKSKRELDAALPAMKHWQLHDLRRSARSLLSRAQVRPDIAERLLGHVIPGVASVYDRHHYETEKGDALQRLAALIDGIVNPRENVVALAKTGKR